MPSPSNPPLSSWPIRLIVYAVLIAIALLSIRVIDRHVMQTMQRHQAPTTTTPQ